MKFFLLFLLFSFTLLNSSFSKILNIENKIQIKVPASHKFIKYDNEDVKNSIEEFVQDYDGMEIDLYLVGPKKYVDLEKAILDGEDPMDNEYVKSIMKKLERKNFKDEERAGKWMISEAKKIMKKEKIDFITYALVSNQSWMKILEDEGETRYMINELQNMDNQELKKATKEIRKEITQLSGNNKSIPINESMTINLSKFEIAKNENDELFLKSNGKLIMIFGAIKLDVMLNVFMTEHKNKTYIFASACYVDCSKFNNKFNNMIKPVFSTNKKNVKKNATNSSNSSNIVNQLDSLNELYKSGVLTKEEFEKAKKKILN